MRRASGMPRGRQIQKTFNNIKITILCGFVTILVLRGTIGVGNLGGGGVDENNRKLMEEANRVIAEIRSDKDPDDDEIPDVAQGGGGDGQPREAAPPAVKPNITYTLGPKISDWDQQRKLWLEQNPEFPNYIVGKPRILLVTGSQPNPCDNAIGDHYLLKAITLYSKARLSRECWPIVLSNRSAAFSRFSEHLRNRSSSLSEYQPLDGLDPTTYAELALKDAEKALSVQPNSIKLHYLKAKALILLERYDEARETLLLGLQVDPSCIPLQKSIQNLERITAGSGDKTRVAKLQRSDDFDCTLCFKLLYEPITTPCGHSFCRSCLLQSMDHGNKCPMCRTVLFISLKAYPVSVTLKNIIQRNFQDEYDERKSELDNLTNMGSDLMPLFVMDVMLPGQKMSLNIFEPRYRLMVVIDPSTGSIADVACEVEICECEPLPDGRFYLEVEGRRRFQIHRLWDQDGYRVAEVEWIQDIYPSAMTREREDLDQLVNKASELVRNWMSEARQAAHTARRAMRDSLLQAQIPQQEDPERFSFWLVNLLGLRTTERLELLRLRDTRERISRALIYMRSEQLSCRVQ